MPLFVIAAADIDAAGRSLEADLPVAWLDEQLGECDVHGKTPGHLSARLSRSGGEVVVRGRVRATVEVACARCLAPANLDIDTELSLLLRPDPAAAAQLEGAAAKPAAPKSPAAKGKAEPPRAAAADKKVAGKRGGKASKEKEPPEYEFSSEDADVDVYDGETVVLDSFVREAILLEMPIFPLCSESCPGIRPASPESVEGGEAPPIDPRLAPLGALQAKLAKAKSSPSTEREPNQDEGALPGPAEAPHEKKTKKE